MNKSAKTATLAIVGILLGFGLCGLDAKVINRGQAAFGGSTSFWGAVIILISALTLAASLIAMIINLLVISFRDRRRQ